LIVSNRQTFFSIDLLVLGLVLGINIFFWKEADWAILGYYFGLALVLYVFCLFLSTGFFISLEDQRRNLRHNVLALLKGVVGANILILCLVFFFFKPYRDILFYHSMCSGAAVLGILCLIRILEWKYVWPRGGVRVLIMGEESYQYLYLKDILFHGGQSDKEILIVISGDSPTGRHHRRSAQVGEKTVRYITIPEARNLITSGSYFSAVVLGRDPLGKELLELLPYCYQNGYSVMGIGPFYEMVCRKVPLFQVGESWLVHTSFQRITPDVLFVKRAFDILLSVILLAIFCPIGLLIALAIKLESPGPALFIQERSGQGGKPFKMYKFRSMYVHADDSHKWPHWEADLVTRMGRFIRKTGLDEWPQLINILKGDMSFVGPRPARPLVTQRHIETIPFYAFSLALRPGVTGWAQLRQGQDTGDQSLLERVRYNLYYAKKYSLLFDLEIILKTFRIALLRKKPKRFQVAQVAPLSSSKEKSGGD
jgi:exopolysaccharide biosynthesis polyprenyl glycosylphosphotransferase